MTDCYWQPWLDILLNYRKSFIKPPEAGLFLSIRTGGGGGGGGGGWGGLIEKGGLI